MSGDVQPRKRKDKRKKKEGTSLGNIHEPVVGTPKFRGKSFDEDTDTAPVLGTVDHGEKIHVHNEHGIGGNICVKIVFFCLLGALVAAIGIIFIHSRGSTDVDLPSVEDSRFADYFTGWLDDASDDHGHDEPELMHGDDDGHEEMDEEDEHGGGHSEEEDAEKSEEDHGEGDVDEDDAVKEADEGSPEAGDNEEDNADDSEEKEDEEDKDGAGDDGEDEEVSAAPKFKVSQRFRQFFKNRKQSVIDKSEEVPVRKWRKVVHVARSEEDENEEEEEEEEEKEEEEDEKEEEKVDSEEEEEEKEEEEDEKEEEKVDSEPEEEDEEMDEGEEGEEEEEEEMEHKSEEDEEDEKEEEKKISKRDEDEEVEEVEEVEEEEEEGKEENKEYEQIDESVEEEEEGKEEEDEDEDIKETREREDEASEEREDDEDDGKVREESQEDALGLDEIDESEEALEEEERLAHGEEASSKEEIDDKSNEPEEKVEDVKDEEIQEVESKIMDIEEKLNQILREKRRKVEQRKMELEKIEIGPPPDVTDDGEGGKEGEGEEEEEESTSNGVAVKLLVGIALIVVAHLVLVRKWKSLGNVPADDQSEVKTEEEKRDNEEGTENAEPVISRRQTLVPEATDLNESFADEIDEEEEEEEEEDEEEEEEDEDEDEEEEEGYSEDEMEPSVVKNRSWDVGYPSRMTNLSKESEEYSEDGEYVEEEEEEYDEEEDDVEEEEEMEEDDFGWKRLEPAKREEKEEEEDEMVQDEPPVPPPRRSHASGERRGGPQGVDDFPFANPPFDELWDSADSTDQGETAGDEKVVEEKPDEDDAFREEYKFAEDLLDNNPTAALKRYDSIVSKSPDSVRALIGRARALDKIAEKEKSNVYLKEAIQAYKLVLTEREDSIGDEEFLKLSERCIERMRFGGYFKSAIEIHKGLIRKFPKNPKFRNDLAVTYLFLNEIPSARALLNDTLTVWPRNGFALVHYGFVLKTADNNHAEAVDKLMAGIRTREPGVIDGRFFFHLGDALNRLGRGKEAMEWYDQGVKEGLFLSRYQRSLYNVNRLKGQPWWTPAETTYQDFFKKLEDNWEKIKAEGLNLLNGKGPNLFKEEAENLKDTGDWRQLDLFFRGRRQPNCDRAPFTCSLIGSFQPASTCTRGQAKFSVMLPSTHVWPHCGPTNCRLRSHLGLVVPKNTFLRVAEEMRSWEEGKVMIFDDSFEHEVWHNGTGPRLVLIIDVWHPELTLQERKYLSPI